MALLTIVDDQGNEHLIHSSQIAPAPRPARATGRWGDAWKRWDAWLLAFDSNAEPTHFASLD